ncbi:MAG: phosphoribosylformylglycinamidine cyclo-ligase [Planctomycetes bacterium]|nr:phosphoribosylformylglycinamidine cyclo-ligase [Planctomycetota bacterium]
MAEQLTYKSSGVDTQAKDGVIDRIFKMMRRTYDPRVIELPWGFSGLFSLQSKHQLFRKAYKNPVLVACTDGVGTKLKIAVMMDKHDTVGIDLVAMSINDLIVCGAEPLFFLDYLAVGKVEENVIVDLVKGIVTGCEQSGCALLGGETAEMPGFYPPGEYDMAGFAVGMAEKSRIITGKGIKAGDIVIGLASNGIHSNGYSLVRKVFFDKAHMKVSTHIDEFGSTLGEELLRPTRIYARAMRDLHRFYRVKNAIKGIAHITGGGIMENVPRVLPKGVSIEIEKSKWKVPPVFSVIQKTGNVPEQEMFRVFNMGIGLIIIVDSYFAGAILKRLVKSGEKPFAIGQVKKGNQQVIIK